MEALAPVAHVLASFNARSELFLARRVLVEAELVGVPVQAPEPLPRVEAVLQSHHMPGYHTVICYHKEGALVKERLVQPMRGTCKSVTRLLDLQSTI